MDIHPPTGAVHSVRDYCIHLSMVVVGILIALSLESALEGHHAHQLAERATHDMLTEIHSNSAQVRASLSELERLQTQLQQQLDNQKKAIDANRNHTPPPSELPVESNFVAIPVLSNAAWDSALAMQAVGRINVDAAETLSRIYSSQFEAKEFQKTFLDVALHFSAYAGRLNNDTAARMEERMGALVQLSAALQNLLGGYRELLHQYSTSKQAGLDG
jgi:hypothetical protein